MQQMQDDAEQRRIHGRQPTAHEASGIALRDAIAHEEALLATLETHKTESRHRLAALQARLAALEAQPEIRVRLPLALGTLTPQTPAGIRSSMCHRIRCGA